MTQQEVRSNHERGLAMLKGYSWGTRVIGGRPSGFVIRDQNETVICIVPRNPPHTQAQAEDLARRIFAAIEDESITCSSRELS